MTDERSSEDRFFEGQGRSPPPSPPAGQPAGPRRGSSLLARSPVFAVLTLGVAGWLLVTLGPDVAFFFASRQPIDLGAPGAYHLDQARENRLVQVRGPLVDPVPVTERRSGAPRTVGRIAGTHLLVDRPGRAGPPVFEGRLLPPGGREEYAEVVAVMRARGVPLGDDWQVLRDGERPRRAWGPVLGAAVVALVAAVNLRALLRGLITRPGEKS